MKYILQGLLNAIANININDRTKGDKIYPLQLKIKTWKENTSISFTISYIKYVFHHI